MLIKHALPYRREYRDSVIEHVTAEANGVQFWHDSQNEFHMFALQITENVAI